MRKFFLISLWIFRLQAHDFIVISLGENCRITDALIAHKVKQHSYPFEWKILDFKALYSCLSEDFRDFYNPDYFVLYFDKQSPVNKYGIVLAHDFPLVPAGIDENGNEKLMIDPNWPQLLPEIQIKYQRRIDRFRAACTSEKKVFFIRYPAITKEEAERLVDLLTSFYPNLDFTLLCINHGVKTIPWNLPRIKNYTLDISQENQIHDQWKAIFIDAGLLQKSTEISASADK